MGENIYINTVKTTYTSGGAWYARVIIDGWSRRIPWDDVTEVFTAKTHPEYFL
jgi:hypothetical protein